MNAYWALLRARFRTLLQYRAAALAGFGTQLFWGLIRVMVFDAFYRSTSAPQPMSYAQTVTYLWLIQAMLLLIPFRLDGEILAMIRDGTVAYELVRPTDLYWYWFSRNVAGRTAPVLLRATPMFLVAGLFLGLRPPVSVAAGLSWLLALVGAVSLSCALGTLMVITGLWTLSGDGIARLLSVAAMVFSGATVPLPFFPAWAQQILDWLPFRGLIDTPFRLYIGHAPPSSAWALFTHQVAWTLILVLLGRWLLSRGLRRLVIQGG